jgi:hypothetical protein
MTPELQKAIADLLKEITKLIVECTKKVKDSK